MYTTYTRLPWRLEEGIDILEQESWEVGTQKHWVLGTKMESSGRTVRALYHWAVSLAYGLIIYIAQSDFVFLFSGLCMPLSQATKLGHIQASLPGSICP